jgi:hypothetical protein
LSLCLKFIIFVVVVKKKGAAGYTAPYLKAKINRNILH